MVPHGTGRSMDIAQERGASVVFTLVPVVKFGYGLHNKREFTDALCVRFSQIFLSHVYVVNQIPSVMPSTVLKEDLFTSDMIKCVVCWRSSAVKL